MTRPCDEVRAALAVASVLAAAGRTQEPGPWRTRDPLDRRMWLGPLVIVALPALSTAAAVAVGWLGGDRGGHVHRVRDILDEGYAAGSTATSIFGAAMIWQVADNERRAMRDISHNA